MRAPFTDDEPHSFARKRDRVYLRDGFQPAGKKLNGKRAVLVNATGEKEKVHNGKEAVRGFRADLDSREQGGEHSCEKSDGRENAHDVEHSKSAAYSHTVGDDEGNEENDHRLNDCLYHVLHHPAKVDRRAGESEQSSAYPEYPLILSRTKSTPRKLIPVRAIIPITPGVRKVM